MSHCKMTALALVATGALTITTMSAPASYAIDVDHSEVSQGTDAADDAQQTFIVQLEGTADLEGAKERLGQAVAAATPGATIEYVRDYHHVFEGFALKAPRSALKAIKGVRGVAAAFAEGTREPIMYPEFLRGDIAKITNPAGVTRADQAVQQGQGLGIEVIDTGLDTSHEAFSGSMDSTSLRLTQTDMTSLTASLGAGKGGAWVSDKIPFVYDYADGDTDVLAGYEHDRESYTRYVHGTRMAGLAAASGKYLAFPDIDDKLYPGMYRTLLEMAEKEHLDIATCNGTYVYEKRRESHPIFPLDRLPSTGVLPGHVWLKQALDSRKFLHVTWLNIYRHDFIRQHHFHFEPGLRHQDIPWTTEALLAAERVQYTSQQFYDYYIHSESVSHKPDNDDTLMRSARHYMKILEMLEAINQRYPDKVRHIAACRWQIAKEGLGIIHTFDSMKDESKKHVIIKEFFDRGIWRLIWKNACTFRLRWRLGRRYLRIKRYRHAG